ncbi:MAG TPA: hypothetical protein VFS20_25100 [Longimicrobium sp.]|nr:hypothetical protein [Longimicrobium sp.]
MLVTMMGVVAPAPPVTLCPNPIARMIASHGTRMMMERTRMNAEHNHRGELQCQSFSFGFEVHRASITEDAEGPGAIAGAFVFHQKPMCCYSLKISTRAFPAASM